jgi:hypothetical protein
MKASQCHILVALFLAPFVAHPQYAITGDYVQTFDTLGAGLPPGRSVYPGATGSSLGTAATFNPAATSWSSSLGQFANFASNVSLASSANASAQAASGDRALGIRQTGTFGDPGASIDFHFTALGDAPGVTISDCC